MSWYNSHPLVGAGWLGSSRDFRMTPWENKNIIMSQKKTRRSATIDRIICSFGPRTWLIARKWDDLRNNMPRAPQYIKWPNAVYGSAEDRDLFVLPAWHSRLIRLFVRLFLRLRSVLIDLISMLKQIVNRTPSLKLVFHWSIKAPEKFSAKILQFLTTNADMNKSWYNTSILFQTETDHQDQNRATNLLTIDKFFRTGAA